jgi:hypothetical protein
MPHRLLVKHVIDQRRGALGHASRDVEAGTAPLAPEGCQMPAAAGLATRPALIGVPAT